MSLCSSHKRFLVLRVLLPKINASACSEFLLSVFLIHDPKISNLKAIALVWLHLLNDLHLGQIEAWYLSGFFFCWNWTWSSSLGFLKILNQKHVTSHCPFFVFNIKVTCSHISLQIGWWILQILNIGILLVSSEPPVTESLLLK